jgi:4-hydroxy-tetrahydrodipicolinate reductase
VPTDKHKLVLENERKSIDLIVDFTQPKSVNSNAELYCEAGIPFVMGTTGGDRQKLKETVEKSNISAVIAANFSDPIVIFMEMLNAISERFPNGLEGFSLFRQESHQGPDSTRPDFKPKTDPSGTMINLQPAFERLIGAPVTTDQIVMIRDRRIQEFTLGIPHEHLDGHAFHTYTLRSADGSVELEFKHNVLGRSTYVPLRAIRYLAKHLKDKGKVYTQVDALKG